MNGRIVVNPVVCHGKPCIAGTRIMVTNILSQLAGGYSVERILEGYPEITRADVQAAIDYAVDNHKIRIRRVGQATHQILLGSN